MADFLTLDDLVARITMQRAVQFLDDDGDGAIAEADESVATVLNEAEGFVYSVMLRAYGAKERIIVLAQNDPNFVVQASWLAAEVASTRRQEFTAADGSGAYKTQFDRATRFFDQLAKSGIVSKGEAVAGRNPLSGGSKRNAPPAGTSDQFVFAPSKGAPEGHGGF